MRYNVTAGEWFFFDGRRWVQDNGGLYAQRLARDMSDYLLIYARRIKDNSTHETFVKAATKYGGLRYRETLVNTIMVANNLCYTPQKGVYLDTPKNGKTRTIDVDPDVMKLLRQLRLEQIDNSVISQYVFTQDGSALPMHPQSPTRYMSKFAKRYGVQDFHPHKLRHSYASIAITNGADVASVSENLGHSDKAVTLRMYTHADTESKKRVSQIVRDALKQKQA